MMMRNRAQNLVTIFFCLGCLIASVATAAVPGPARGSKAMVVTAHPDATRVGLQILRDGGNAVDAAVGVAFALSVVEPYSSGIGGGGFTLYYDNSAKKVHALDGRETAPAALRQELFHPSGTYRPELARWSGLSVGVPGLVAQMYLLHQKFGALPFERVIQPSIDLAQNGLRVSEGLAARIAATQDHMSDAAKKIFLPNGRVPEVGALIIQADKAWTLTQIKEQGPKGFYTGPVAQKLSSATRAAGGVMTTADLDAYVPVWREPVSGPWRGMDVYSFPPPSSGGAVLLRMLHGVGEGKDLAAAGWHSAHEIHVLTELMKRAYADRNQYMADPDFVTVPMNRFVDPKFGKKDRKSITKRATPARKILNPKKLRKEGAHTSHFSIVDEKGNAVSQTQTINLTFGSGILAEGTGVFLNNEMDDFSTAPGRANAFGLVQGSVNAVSPGKRPLSSMTPTIALRGGAVEAVVGSPGGSRIITSVFQTLLNRYLHKMSATESVCMPRFHHQWLPDFIQAERFAISAETATKLGRKRHVIHEVGAFSNVQAIFRGPSGWEGASDCRQEGLALGY